MPRPIILILLLVAPTLLAQTTRPFTIAPDTTVVTGPVRADGTLDFVAAMNQLASAGVTNDNNAAALLLQAMPTGKSPPAVRLAAMRRALALPAPDKSNTFVDLSAFVAANAGQDKVPTEDLAYELHDAVLNAGAWKTEDAPFIAQWLAANQKSLDLAVEASRRPRFYMPAVCDTQPAVMMNVQYPWMNPLRAIATALKTRALLRLGEGNFDAFRSDALAVVRLGRLATQHQTLIGKLVAIGCQALGVSIYSSAATFNRLSESQAHALIDDLSKLPAPSSIAACFDTSERFMLLEYLTVAAIYGPIQASRFLKGDTDNLAPIDTSAHDWNNALRKSNTWYDRIAAAARQPTYALRNREGQKVGNDIEALSRKYDAVPPIFVPLEDRMLLILLPSMSRAFTTESRQAVEEDQARIALALCAYRHREKAYPKSLDQLSPRDLKTLPHDFFTAAPFLYESSDSAYTLTSPGPDQQLGPTKNNKTPDDITQKSPR